MRKIFMALVLAMLFLPMVAIQNVGATGWGECGWSINYPIETSDHRAHAYGSFACTGSGTRTLKLEIWKDNSLFADIRVAKKSVTFYGTDSGGFTLDSPVCSNTSSGFVYYGRAWMINPDTGNQSSAHRGESRTLTINCGAV